MNEFRATRTGKRLLLGVFAVTVTPTMLAGCGAALLSPAGPVANAERTILLNSLAIMLAIVIPTILCTLSFAWWYRNSNVRARYRPDWAYSGRLELMVWSIPALAILFLGGIAWLGSHDLDPAQPLRSRSPPLEIQVVSLDWKWLFIYPTQNTASVNLLVVPAGIPLHLSITSATVMNVFFVPRLGSEIYAMNGMRSQLNLQADEQGIYFGSSVNFSGDGFSDMAFDVRAVAPAEFAAWSSETHRRGPVLDAAAYRDLLRQSRNISPYTYRSVRPGLFSDIVTQRLPPGEGPQTGRPGPAVRPSKEP